MLLSAAFTTYFSDDGNKTFIRLVQKKYQDEQKAKMVAKLVKEQEEEKAKYEKELQESEESNRTLILQFTLVQVGGLYAVRCGRLIFLRSGPCAMMR